MVRSLAVISPGSTQVKLVEDVDALDRLAMACPALPLCGLAMTEAERRMSDYTQRIRAQLIRQGLG